MTSASVPVWTTRPCFEDDDAVGEGVGVDGVVGDEEADAVERGEVAAQVAADVAAGAGVEGGERLVEEEQRAARWPGRGRGRRAGPGRRTGRGAGGGRGRRARRARARPRPRRGPRPWRCRGRAARRRRSRGRSGWGTGGSPGRRRRPVVARAGRRRRRAGSSSGSPSSSMRPVVDRQQPGEAAEQRALAGAVGTEDGDGLAALRRSRSTSRRNVPRVRTIRASRVMRPVAAPPPRNRSRRATSTPKETAMSTRLSTIASSGSISLVR